VNKKTVKEYSSADNTADIIVDKLIAWEVEFVFTLVGDGVNPIFEALRKRKEEIRLITVRHEEAAAFMASGYAKNTGKLGVCLGTSGPGAVHLMNGLYDAAMEGAPVLALTGIVPHDVLGTNYTQEVDTVALMGKVAVYNQQITGPIHAQTIVDLACRTALTTPGVAHLTVATDVQQMALSKDKHSQKGGHLTGSSSFTPRKETPPDAELAIAAELLNNNTKIAILVGRGALHARSEVTLLAETLGAPVAKALLGKAVLPDDSPLTTGGTGRLGTLPSKKIMSECEVLLIIGSTMPWLEYYPEKAKAIQIDNNPQSLGLRYPIDIGLCGDVQATLQALILKLKQQTNRSFLEKAQAQMEDWRKTIAKLEDEKATPIKPQYLVAQVSKLIKEDAHISIDTGAHTVFTARHLKIKPQQQITVCGNLASMAPGLPYAIAAQLAYPGRQCIAMVGDGGFTMLMGEMATAVLYNLPIKVIIFKNNTLAMDAFEQEEIGAKRYGIELQDIDFTKIAEACGAEACACNDPRELAATLSKAFASDKPYVIQVDVEPRSKAGQTGRFVIKFLLNKY
jgi:thiamine pyrophosphate-dependent acetolactate synthase large subunit-like protein